MTMYCNTRVQYIMVRTFPMWSVNCQHNREQQIIICSINMFKSHANSSKQPYTEKIPKHAHCHMDSLINHWKQISFNLKHTSTN